MRQRTWLIVSLLISGGLTACTDGSEPVSTPMPLTRVQTDRTYLRDTRGRYIFLNGVNLSCTTKVVGKHPVTKLPTYVGRPFPLSIADQEFARLRAAGFNSIRLLVIWEGVEPEKKGQYNEEYLDYLRKIVELAAQYQIYVLMDMHQDMFSRHLLGKFNSKPEYGEPGSLEHSLLSLAPHLRYGYTDAVQGDGAPRWAVQACLQEKNFDSKYWGIPRLVSGLDGQELVKIYDLFKKLTGQVDTGGPPPDWATTLGLALQSVDKFAVNETTDVLPLTNWGLAHSLSVDIARCYMCLFAGDKVFPDLKVGGVGVQEYLQEAYVGAWLEVVKRVKDLPNVIGYDLMNEPSGNAVILSAVGAMIRTGLATGARDLLVNMLGAENGEQLFQTLITLKLLPPDTKPETLKLWGLDKLDLIAAIGLNNGFDENYLRPFYERVGQAIVKLDPEAMIFIENSKNISFVFGGYGGIGGFWEVPMSPLRGLEQRVVFAPHWYPDIYPFPGINVWPREFTPEQVRYRDYQPNLEGEMKLSSYSLGNVPVIFGEFGTYFNFNNRYVDGKYFNLSQQQNYQVSSHVLDNYYEAFERMFTSRMLWCYSSDNDQENGDWWNHEDFSVLGFEEQDPQLGPVRKLRSELAWNRPYPRALAGKPIAMHFNSDFHYFDPDKGQQIPRREFEVRYASKESSAPTEVFVPQPQYSEGFYVWVSDGYCYYDHKTAILYHYPSRDEPGVEHWIRIQPPLPNQQNLGWNYFFKGDKVLRGR